MAENESAAKGNLLGALAPLVGFLLVVGVALALWLNQQAGVREHQEQVEHNNIEAGLPRDFPSDVIPLFEGASVTSQETGEAESTDGEPMKMWKYQAQIDDDDRTRIFDFYNDLLLDNDFRQTQYISIPSHDGSGPNYAVDFGSEEMSVSFIIEKKTSDEMTQIFITVYRVE